MQDITWLDFYTFPTAEWPLASLCVGVDEIASRHGAHARTWDDDGLGPARGLACRVTSGRVFVLVEHELSIRYGYAKGPLVLVDAAELGELRALGLVGELREALGLSDAEVAGVTGLDGEQAAARIAEVCRSRSPKA
jgi:hypothetical protein